MEYIDLYKKESLNSPLQRDAKEALDFFKTENYVQIILSASEQKALEIQVKDRDIFEYFDSILGLDNIHAKSKLNNALDYIRNCSFNAEQILLIGDTFHDYEVAKAIGCKSILVNNGHQHLNQFKFDDSNTTIDELKDIHQSLRSKVHSEI